LEISSSAKGPPVAASIEPPEAAGSARAYVLHDSGLTVSASIEPTLSAELGQSPDRQVGVACAAIAGEASSIEADRIGR
jgi:hypothetical protein